MPHPHIKIQKSFNYHFFYAFDPLDIVELGFFNQVMSDYYVNYPREFAPFIQQGMCDILANENGIVFNQMVLNGIGHQLFYESFNSCCVYQMPIDITNRTELYKRNFCLETDIRRMRESIDMDQILHYDKTEWKEILALDPDAFYIKGFGAVVFGAKDLSLVEEWYEHCSFEQKWPETGNDVSDCTFPF
jgi:hypothetical protein